MYCIIYLILELKIYKMKKLLLFVIIFLGHQLNLISQIEFKIESPASIAGSFGFSTTADPGISPAGWTATPDLNDTANAVLDTLMFVEDGTTGTNPQGNPISQEGCNPLINDLTGKIAVVWRNSCQFGDKVINAQNAGARAVIIINREPGLINMAPGNSGAFCTIPAVMVEYADGLTIANAMANGPVVAFMGTRYFAKNLSINQADIIRPRAAATPLLYAQNSSEYDVQVGSWVVNNGTDSSDAILNATITYGGTNLYNQSTNSVALGSGDSIYFTLPTFSQASYNTGIYNITYSLDTTGDGFQSDNLVSQNFHITDNTKFSNVPLDSNENMVLDPFYRPSGATGSVSFCTAFQDPNASRLAALGLSFAAVVSGGDLSNRYFTTYAYQWNDVFTDLDDPAAAISSLNIIGTGQFTYPNDSAYQEVYVPFVSNNSPLPVPLVDNQRYLFCVNTFDTDVYIGFNNSIDYNQNVNDIYKQPIDASENNGFWTINSFGTDLTAGISVEMKCKNLVSITDSFCGVYDFNGTILSLPGTYYDTLTSVQGCDSIITLNLTNSVAYGTDYISACDSYTWIDGNTYTSSNNTAVWTLQNSAGCDSNVTLNLTIVNIVGVDSISSCNSYTWIDGNTYTSSNDSATYTLQTSAGCDSVVTLNLTINSLPNPDFSSNVSSFTSAPFVVEFSNTTPNISDYNFTWDFGDDSTLQSNNSIVFHEYQYNGLYDVMLIAENILTGCVDTMLKTDNIYCAGGPNLSIIEVSNNINVFPNPTNEDITIIINNFNGNFQTEVFDLIGNSLQTTEKTTISLRDYARGIYLLKVSYGDRVEEIKVIKE